MVDLASVARCLEGIYGPGRAAALLPRVTALCRKYGATLFREPAATFSEADAILITYPDQVRTTGKSPLACLADFLRMYAGKSLTGLHLLPFFPASSDDGFAVQDYRAVDAAYGGWDDIRALGGAYRLMLDAVINHTSTSSRWFQGFLRGDPNYADFYVRIEGSPDVSGVVRPRTTPLLTHFGSPGGTQALWTTFGPDQADLNYGNPEVLLEVIDLLLYYAARGASIIRLDAIAYLWKDLRTSCVHCAQTHLIVKLFRALFDGLAPHVALITETNVPQEDNFAYTGNGSDEAHLIYNFPLAPLVLHAFHSGQARRLAAWARELPWPGDGATYFNILASHDGIGLNPVRGILTEDEIDLLVREVQEGGGLISSKSNADGTSSPYEINANYFDALSCPGEDLSPELKVGRFLTAHAILLAFRGLPGIYFHSFVGSRGWRQGPLETGRNRSINRQKLDFTDLVAELGEPGGRRGRIHDGMRRLLHQRTKERAFAPMAPQRVIPTSGPLFAFVRGGDKLEEQVLCVHNVTNKPQALACDAWGVPPSRGALLDLISGRQVEWPLHGTAALEPFQSMWLRMQRRREIQ